ncbi:MAG: LysR family transcriptional regulator [Betaproteobacteria bacterium]|nr:LysR family transcriptional regulator [Betaproteobacteria bacterium]
MNLLDLKLFLAIANTGSFSRAAALEGLTQSAASKRILQLELGLGQRLFSRNGRGAALTQAGQFLVNHAQALVRDADQLPQLLRGALAKPGGVVRMAVQASISWPLVQYLHPTLERLHPDIRLQLVEAPTRQVAEWVQENRIDLGVLSDWGSDKLPQTEPLFSSRLLLVGPAGDALCLRARIRFAQLSQIPLIVSPMPNGARVLLEAQAKDAGRPISVMMEVHSVHLIKKMVHDAWGYTVALSHSVHEEIQRGQLSATPIVAPAMSQRFYITRSNQYKASSATDAVAELIRHWAQTQNRPKTKQPARRPASPARGTQRQARPGAG